MLHLKCWWCHLNWFHLSLFFITKDPHVQFSLHQSAMAEFKFSSPWVAVRSFFSSRSLLWSFLPPLNLWVVVFDWWCGWRLVIEIGGSLGLGLVWMEVVVASSVYGLLLLLPVSSFYKTLTSRSSFICFLICFFVFFWLVKWKVGYRDLTRPHQVSKVTKSKLRVGTIKMGLTKWVNCN